jgi:acetyltransferase-like isoleucine patch superfamily enzyme
MDSGTVRPLRPGLTVGWARPGGASEVRLRRVGEDGRVEPAFGPASLRLFVIRTLNYLTNHVVSHVPSFTFRHWWYERLLGIRLGRGVVVHMGCFLWSYTPRIVRLNGVSLGDYCYINRNCCLDIRGPLKIGNNVSVSPEVMILTATHGVNDPGFPIRHKGVLIEDHVWIGSRAVILPGVTLGRGCVVAAGAVVTRDVKALEVVAGVPARRVGLRDEAAPTYTLNGPLPLFE